MDARRLETTPANAAIATLSTTATIPAAVSISCHALGASLFSVNRFPPDNNDVGRESQVEAAQHPDPMRVRDLLDGGLNQTQECRCPTNANTGNKISANA